MALKVKTINIYEKRKIFIFIYENVMSKQNIYTKQVVEGTLQIKRGATFFFFICRVVLCTTTS